MYGHDVVWISKVQFIVNLTDHTSTHMRGKITRLKPSLSKKTDMLKFPAAQADIKGVLKNLSHTNLH